MEVSVWSLRYTAARLRQAVGLAEERRESQEPYGIHFSYGVLRGAIEQAVGAIDRMIEEGEKDERTATVA